MSLESSFKKDVESMFITLPVTEKFDLASPEYPFGSTGGFDLV